MTDYHGPERRQASSDDVSDLRQSISDLDNTIRTLFLSKADAERQFPKWSEVDERIHRLELKLDHARSMTFRKVVALLLVGFLLWTPLVMWAVVQLQDFHNETCGPANRPETRSEQVWCNRWAPAHDHPIRAQSDDELADRLLRSLGIDPERYRRRTTTTTSP